MARSGPPGSELDIADNDSEEVVPAEMEGAASSVLFIVAVVLMTLAPFATRPQPAGKAWYLAPVNWPLFSLGMTATAGGILAWRFVAAWRSTEDPTAFRTNMLGAFGGLGFAFEYSLYFCAYLLAVAWVGFTVATLVFLQFIVWRAGLRGARWMATTLFLTVGIVLVFRLGIGIWFPLAPIYKLLPAWVGNSLGGVL